MDDLVQRFFGKPLMETNGGLVQAWAPSCDVEETDNQIIVKADLPGVEPKDIDISITENTLVVRSTAKSRCRRGPMRRRSRPPAPTAS
jgi:HSP20 family protein